MQDSTVLQHEQNPKKVAEFYYIKTNVRAMRGMSPEN